MYLCIRHIWASLKKGMINDLFEPWSFLVIFDVWWGSDECLKTQIRITAVPNELYHEAVTARQLFIPSDIVLVFRRILTWIIPVDFLLLGPTILSAGITHWVCLFWGLNYVFLQGLLKNIGQLPIFDQQVLKITPVWRPGTTYVGNRDRL
jgi:hypothetical protein